MADGLGPYASALARLLAARRQGQQQGEYVQHRRQQQSIAQRLAALKEQREDALAQSLIDFRQRAPKQQPQYFVDDAGNVTVTQEGAPGHPVAGVKGKKTPPRAGEKPIFTPNERRAAEQVITALSLQNQLEEQDPEAGVLPTAANVALQAGKLPVIGGVVQGLTGPAAQKLLKPTQAEFRRAGITAQHHYLSLLPHSRGSLGILEHIAEATQAPAGQTDPGVLAQYRQARQDIIDQLQAALGAPGPTTPAPSATPTPQVPEKPPAPLGYNKKFWRRRTP